MSNAITLSKELITKVQTYVTEREDTCTGNIQITGNTLHYERSGTHMTQMNLHEFVANMKEWIFDWNQAQGICSHKAYCCSYANMEWYSGYLHIKTTYDDKVKEEIKGKGDTELDAVREHCEWIMKWMEENNV